MLSVAIAALRSRRSQNVALMILACLVVAGVFGAPFYVFAAEGRVVTQDLLDAPAAQQQVTMSEQISLPERGAGAIDQTLSVMRSQLTLPGATEVTGLRVGGNVLQPVALNIPIADRDSVCAHVTIEGACPVDVHDIMVSATTAAVLGLHVGDSLPWPGPVESAPPMMRVSGLYRPLGVTDPYWGDSLLVATRTSVDPAKTDAMFVTRAAMMTFSSDVTYERVLLISSRNLTVADADAIGGRVRDASVTGPSKGLSVTVDVTTLTDRIDADSRQLMTTIPVLAGEIVALGWFALFLVVRASARNRQTDTGLVRLRGVPRGTVWSLMAVQSAIPIVAALPIGAIAGYLAAGWLAGDVPTAGQRRLAVLLAAGGAVVVVLGVLVAAALAEWRSRRTPVIELFRQTPPRRRGWRSDAVDVVVLALAIFGVVQGRSGSDPASSGLVMLTPALVALAVGLIVGRSLAPIATATLRRSLRSGHPIGILTATYLARRSGLDRIFALLVIAVALAANAIIVWHVAAQAQDARATQEVGAHRVILVRGSQPARVLAATRTADPSGRYAMAAAEYNGLSPEDAVLAVDSTRLAAVLADGTVSGATLAPLLRPALRSGTDITTFTTSGDQQSLSVDAIALGSGRVFVLADLIDGDGTRHLVPFGPLQPGLHEYRGTATGCTVSCRLAGFELAASLNSDGTVGQPPAGGVSIILTGFDHGLTADLANRSLWRAGFDIDTVGPALSTSPDGLDIELPAADRYATGSQLDTHVYLVDVPIPAPIVLAGALPAPAFGGTVEIKPFGEDSIPVTVAGTEPVLPRIGRAGAYIDLDYALRLTQDSGVLPVSEVWLRDDTPPRVVDALRTAGLTFSVDTTTDAARARYRDQGTEAGRRFALFGGGIAAVLAGIALLLVAGMERRPRAREMAALRRQGVDRRTVRLAAIAGYAWLAGGALVVGLAAVAVNVVIGGRVGGEPGGAGPIFADGWMVLPPPSAFAASGWLLVCGLVGLPILAVGLLAGALLERTVTTGEQVIEQ